MGRDGGQVAPLHGGSQVGLEPLAQTQAVARTNAMVGEQPHTISAAHHSDIGGWLRSPNCHTVRTVGGVGVGPRPATETSSVESSNS